MVAALVAACTHASKPTAPGCCDKSGIGRAGDAGPDARVAMEAAPAKAPARFRLEETCARDLKPNGEAVQDMAELQRVCAQGLAPLLPAVVSGKASGTEPLEVPFRVSASPACLRAGVVGATKGFTLSILSERGTILASSVSMEPLALVPVDGTVCVREPGAYRVVVRPAPPLLEASAVNVQVWQASRD